LTLADLRHSYAVAALQSGDDIKTVQENLGHHTAAFTLDVYGHVTDRMKQASADRMEGFIKSVSSL
jgi:site-specific recombinase XerD